MKKTRLKYFFILIAIFNLFSCNDWINLLPPQGLIREEFWKKKEDVEAVLMGAYSSLSHLDSLLFKHGEIRADMVKGDVNQSLNEQKIMEGTIYPENGLCKWSSFYKVIDYCNEVIKNAPAVKDKDNTFSDFQLQGFLSEAYFLRSLCYFYLVRIFKDVPYITEPTEGDDADFYIPKTDGDQILNQIVSDLIVYRDFSTYDGYQTLKETKGRATKAAFDALLADIALWRFDYQACIDFVQKIEVTQRYDLMPSSRWFEIFIPGNSLEGIFEFQFDNSLNQNNSIFDLTNHNSYKYDPSPFAIELFGKKFARELYRGEDASIGKYGDNDYVIWKFVGRSPDGKTLRTGTEQNSCNWIVYRYADVLLMKAEALSQLNRFQEALTIINQIRFRADVAPLVLANSATAYEDAILNERALELAFEGKRWFDLLRMGRRNNFSRKSKLIEIVVENVNATQKRILAAKLTNPLGWYLPIYKSEIERNRNLIQNPYYNF